MAGLIRKEDIDEVRARTDIREIIEGYVSLKSAGIGTFKGLCPFHDERTPSFNVRPQVGSYHCFGCGESGDVYSFVMAMEHTSFVETVERLAARIGYTLHYEGGKPGDRYEAGMRRRLLDALLPERENWQPSGLLHLNHNPAETRRNAALAAQKHHAHLYRGVSAAEAGAIAGIDMFSDGLYWPQGAWLHPPALVRALLAHPHITLCEHTPLLSAQWSGGAWQLQTPAHTLSAQHIVYCTGAQSPHLPALSPLPWQLIRGQTGLAAATPYSGRLKTALSAATYISPAWQGQHCYGASFIPHDAGSDWREADAEHNRRELERLHPQLAADLSAAPAAAGHAAVRCDSPDHLPVVGRLADYAAMKQVYAKLAHDKNYPLDAPCPWLPNARVNAAHGSRGLATAPWCAEQTAAEILGLPQPFSRRLREALHPNRHIVRALVRQHEAG